MLFLAQVLFYLVALVGLLVGRASWRGVKAVPSYFLLVNSAAAAATFQFLAGRRIVVWNPRKGA